MERREKIKLVRSMLNMDSGELEKATGYNQSSIRLMESGRRPVTDDFLMALSTTLDVRLDWLMDDADEEPTVENIFSKYYEVDGKVYPRKAMIPELQAGRVREVLDSTGLIQKEFCKETGWTLSNLQDMLNGKRKMSVRYAERIEKRYGVGVGWLLYGIEEEKNYPLTADLENWIRGNCHFSLKVRKTREIEKNTNKIETSGEF